MSGRGPKLRHVQLEWDDTVSGSTDWAGIEEVPRIQRMHTTGWIILEDDDQIIICSTLDLSKPNQYSETIAIPKGCIKHKRNVA
jgi:hypothetical protein